MLDVADGRIAIYAYERAKQRENTFVFTEDEVLKGIIEEINKELYDSDYPLIIAGGINDYERYSYREIAAS